MRKLNLLGKKFGHLTVISESKKLNTQASWWLCECDCANKTRVVRQGVKLTRKGRPDQSCGCAHGQRGLTHGHSKHINGRQECSKLYRAWAAMIQRCTNDKDKSFKRYGGRGIKICKRWEDFENFLKDLGPTYEPGLTIERKDVNKGYFPKNVTWATPKEQSRNRRDTLWVTFKGETKCLGAWCEEIGFNYYTVRRRIFKYGWDPERAFFQ
jgi:hypothetical protein